MRRKDSSILSDAMSVEIGGVMITFKEAK